MKILRQNQTPAPFWKKGVLQSIAKNWNIRKDILTIFSALGTFSSLAWRRQWQSTPVLLPGKSHGWRSLVGYSPWSREHTTERLHFHFSLSCIGEGNSNPLQCSFRDNPRDGGAWWAAVYGVTQSRTRLKWLSSSSSSSLVGLAKVLPNDGVIRNYKERPIFPPDQLGENISPYWGGISSSPHWHWSHTLSAQPCYYDTAPALEY